MTTSRSSRRIRARHIAAPAVLCGLAIAAPSFAAVAPDAQFGTDLAITKATDAASYSPGQTITYTIVVTNAGRDAVDGDRIRVSDPSLPTLAPTGDVPAVLAPGETLVYTGTRLVYAKECGAITNTATVALAPDKTKPKKDADDENPANDTASVTVPIQGGVCAPPPPPPPPPLPVLETPPAAVVGKPAPRPCPLPNLRAGITGPRTLSAGKVARYRVSVRNAGANASTSTTLRVVLPNGFTLAQRRGALTLSGRTVRTTLGRIAPRATRTLTLRVRPVGSLAGRRVVRARVTSACGPAKAATAVVRVAAVRALVQPAVTG